MYILGTENNGLWHFLVKDTVDSNAKNGSKGNRILPWKRE